MIGKNILNYEIKKLLGEGGMGNVYLAEHAQIGRKVAIKSLHQQLVKNEGLRARFKNEASTMAHLQHPKIVTLYDYVEEADGLYLVMEYVEGLPLDEYIKEKSGPIPSEKAIPMMIQILDAFSYAHSKGIVHRDIKPSNILISSNGDIKILDFGIAKMISEAGNKLTKTGTQMGTVFYMSPEQVQGKEVDVRSDIYSLGVTFYQMLTGASPYDGMTTEYEIYSKILAEPLPAASLLYPSVPDFLDKVILKATAKNKEDRFQNCEAFSTFLSKRESPSIERKTVVQTISPAPSKAPEPRIFENQAKKSKAPLIGLIVIVGLVGVIGLGIWIANKPTKYNSEATDYITEATDYGNTNATSTERAPEITEPEVADVAAAPAATYISYNDAQTLYERFANAVVAQNDYELLACLAPTLRIWYTSQNKDREQIITNYHNRYFNKWTVTENALIELTQQANPGEFRYKKRYTIISTSDSDNKKEYEISGYFVVNSDGQFIEMQDQETIKTN